MKKVYISKFNLNPLLLLIDGNSLAFNCYFTYRNNNGNIITSVESQKSLSLRFIKTIVMAIKEDRPEAIAVVFHDNYSFSNATNSNSIAIEDDFKRDLQSIRLLLAALSIQIINTQEIDERNILGTLAKKANSKGYRIKILSNDKHLFQLVNDKAKISIACPSSPYAQNNFSCQEINESAVFKKMNVTPEQIIDYKALRGDLRSNIPGIIGMGDLTVIDLLAKYQNLENIYNCINKISERNKKLLIAGEKQARYSQQLARIDTNIPISVDISKLRLSNRAIDKIEKVANNDMYK